MLPVALAVALATTQASAPATVTLEVRVFNGVDDVTAESRVAVYRAGERAEPLARFGPRQGSLTTMVPAGFYDVQAIREKDGRVLGIRWAERLVVMAYPDEKGRHLEIVNLQPGFGALQVRSADGSTVPDVALYVAGLREKEAAPRLAGDGYALFVVPAGSYDVLVRGAKPSWHAQIEIPSDRTRLWLAQ
jgi:hypothetical protein